MAPLTSTHTPDTSSASGALSFLQVPNPIDWLTEADGDPDDLEASVNAFSEAADGLTSATNEMTGGQGSLVWQGPGFDAFDYAMSLLETGVKGIIEGILWIIEWVVAIIDFIITLFSYIAALVLGVVFAIWIIAATVVTICTALAGTVVGSGGIPGVIASGIAKAKAVMSTGFMVKCGTVMLFGTGMAVLAEPLKAVVDAIHEKLAEWRSQLVGYTGDTPNWDAEIPTRWPSFPGI